MSFPVWLLLFCFVSGSFNFISKIDNTNMAARAILIVIVLFTNVFIWMFYDKEKG